MKSENRVGDEFGLGLLPNGDYRIINVPMIEKIVEYVYRGEYVYILGPRHSQKGLLLEDVAQRIIESNYGTPIMVDLAQLSQGQDDGFLRGLAVTIDRELQDREDSFPKVMSTYSVKGKQSFRRFMIDCLRMLPTRLVLLLKGLNDVHIGPLRALLKVLRALYMESDESTPRLGLVIASSLDLAPLSLEPTSPLFNIVTVMVVEALSPKQTEYLIQSIFASKSMTLTQSARQRLSTTTGGDRYLTVHLCNTVIERASVEPAHTVDVKDVEEAIGHFMQFDADQYEPLHETIRAIEADADVLLSVVKILETKGATSAEICIAPYHFQGIDRLQLTGAVRLVSDDSEMKKYGVRNEIYERYLWKHFCEERVVHCLTVAGRWSDAVDYLVPRLRRCGQADQLRYALLGVGINAVYTAIDVQAACQVVCRLLYGAFALNEVRIYLLDRRGSALELESYAGNSSAVGKIIRLGDSSKQEITAYFREDYSIWENEKKLMVPLRRTPNERLGLVVIEGFVPTLRDRVFHELLAFLAHVGRAVKDVIDRIDRQLQLATLYEMSEAVTSSVDLQQILRTTLQAVLAVLSGAEEGSIYLWDPTSEQLLEHWSCPSEDDNQLPNPCREPYVLESFQQGDSRLLDGAICVPLRVWSQTIGMLCLRNLSDKNAFHGSSPKLLSTFVSQASLAIQNVRIRQELYRLECSISRGDIEPREIFRQTVESIIRVSGAKGAHMCLFRGALHGTTRRNLENEYSAGLGAGLGEKFRPRDDGLTAMVKNSKEAAWVESPDHRPGINPEMYERGVRASLCLPLWSSDSMAGVIYIHYEEEHKFSNNEREMLSLFANSAIAALENASLLKEKDERTHRLKQLNEMARDITAKHDLDELLKSISLHVVQLIGAGRSVFYLVDVEKRRLLKAQGHEYNEEKLAVLTYDKIEKTSSGWCLKSGEADLLLNAQTDSRNCQAEQELLARLRVTSQIVAPLMVRGKTIGVLTVCNKRNSPSFSKNDLELVEMLALQAAVAVENSRHYKENKLRTQLFGKLDEAQRSLHSGYASLLHNIAFQSTVEIMQCKVGVLLKNYPNLKQLELVYAIGSFDGASTSAFHHSNTKLAEVINSGEAQVLTAIPANDALIKHLSLPNTKPIFAVPLTHVGGVEFVLLIVGDETTREFANTYLDVLNRFAQRASRALVTHPQYGPEATKQRASHLHALHKISSYAQHANDLSQVLHGVLTMVTAGYGLGFNRAALMLVDGSRTHLVGNIGVGLLDESAARTDWEEHKKRNLEDFDRYVACYRESNLPSTPVHERIAGLTIPLTDDDRDALSTVVRKGHLIKIEDEAEIGNLDEGFVAAFGPGPPMVIVPLRVPSETVGMESNVIGLLVVDNKFTKADIIEADMESLLTIANTAAISIRNDTLFRDNERALEELKELDRRKTEFFSTVSHELRTPLSSFKAYIENMLSKTYGPISEQQESKLRTALDSARRESELIDNLLNFAVIQEGKAVLKPSLGNIRTIVDDVVRLFENDAAQRHISLSTNYPDSNFSEFEMDASKIKQVTTNLISNALRFTPDGGKVTITVLEKNNEIQVQVVDTGFGISEEHLPRVFDRFHRVDSPEISQAGGTGIGLSIAKEYIDMHEGRIWAKSSLGKGSTFIFSLPLTHSDTE